MTWEFNFWQFLAAMIPVLVTVGLFHSANIRRLNKALAVQDHQSQQLEHQDEQLTHQDKCLDEVKIELRLLTRLIDQRGDVSKDIAEIKENLQRISDRLRTV